MRSPAFRCSARPARSRTSSRCSGSGSAHHQRGDRHRLCRLPPARDSLMRITTTWQARMNTVQAPATRPRRGTRNRAGRPRATRSVLLALGAAVLLLLSLAGPSYAASPSASYVQGSLFDTGSPTASLTVTLSKPVQAGDLLVGWFAQY